jgi:hypothetical protein
MRQTAAHARLKTAPQSPPKGLFIGWYTSVADGHAHAVTDEAFIEGAAQGQFKTVCGLVIWLTASVAPFGHPCPRCAAVLRIHASTGRTQSS